MSILFYNAGDRIDEVLSYSITNGEDPHCIARWHLQAPREDFFEVPTELTIRGTGETVATQFAADILRKFGRRGVIRIDTDYDARQEDPDDEVFRYPRAATREASIERGKQIWMHYLRTVVEAHLRDCESARAAGGAPRSAVGFTKRALKLLEIKDPGEQYFASLASEKSGDPAVAELRTQNQIVLALLMQVLQGKVIDPAEIAALQAQGATPKSVVASGVMTGQVKKPIAIEESGAPARNKAERSRAAAEQLEKA